MPDTVVVVPEELDPIIIEIHEGLQGVAGPQGVQGPAGPTTLIIADVCYDTATGNDAGMYTLLQEGDVVDGVTLTAGMIVFVAYRTTPTSSNGFWRVQAGGANPIREPSISTFSMMVGSLLSIKWGTKWGRTVWTWVGGASGTIGTDPILYDRLSEQSSFIMMRDVGIVEKTEILIPQFYYVDGREGMILVTPPSVAPTQTRYFTAPLSTSKTNIIRVWYDRAYHIANPSDPQGAIKSETNVTRVTTNMYQEPEICVSNFGNVTSRYNFIGDSAGVSQNICVDSLFPQQSALLAGTDVVLPFTDSALLALGLTHGIRGATTSHYQGYTVAEPLMGNEYFFCRFYLETTVDNTFGTGPSVTFRSVNKVGAAVAQISFNMTLEKQLSTKAAIYSVAGVLTPAAAGVTRILVGMSSGPTGTITVGGAQIAIQRNSPANWIMRNDFPRAFSCAPIMSKELWLNTGRVMPLHLRNLFPMLTMEDMFYGGIASVQTSNNNYPYVMSSEDTLRIDPALLGSTCQLAVMSYSDVNRRYVMDLDVHTVASVGLTGSPRVMIIGDTVMNQLSSQLFTKLQNMGLTPVAVGTIPGSSSGSWNSTGGPVGEYRFSQGWGDLSGLVDDADTPDYFALGTEATYTALSKVNKYTQNPFLRLATGGDSPTYTTVGGYIFDFRHYLNRFNFADPDVVIINLGLEDILERATIAEAVADVNLIVPFILSKIREACPGIKIGVFSTLPGMSDRAYTLWPMVQAVNAAIATAVNAQPWGTFLIPVHAHVNHFVGWPVASGSVVNAATGYSQAPMHDPSSPAALSTTAANSLPIPVAHQVVEPLAAFVSNVQTWLPNAVKNRANVLAAGGTMSDTEFYFRNSFFGELQVQGLLPYIDEFWFGTTVDAVAQQVTVSALKGIVGTGFNSPAYAPSGTVFGSTTYIRTGYIPSVHGTVITGTNFGVLYYDRVQVTSNSTYSLGMYVSDTENLLYASKNGANRHFGSLNNVATSGAIVDGRSLQGMSRNATDREEWRLGVSLGTTALGTNGTSLPSIEMIIGGYNNNGTRAGPRNTTMQFAAITGGMDAAKQLAMYNAVQAMMTARGWAI